MTEQQPYDVVREYGSFELRRYPSHLVAETTVEGGFEAAGSRAFRLLFAYISGANRSSQAVSMTAPVVQSAGSQKIAMTAPVVQEAASAAPVPEAAAGTAGTHRVAFVLPSDFTLDTAPQPTDPRVVLRKVLEEEAAVIRFSGRWSAARYSEHLDKLLEALPAVGLVPKSGPRFARFDPPYRPWFLRRNEIIVPVDRPLHREGRKRDEGPTSR